MNIVNNKIVILISSSKVNLIKIKAKMLKVFIGDSLIYLNKIITMKI